ncbi:hypothetical protein OF83DRAFT_1065909 [Amylostereum chailletii]|nr:hypothetical protein OF83DRAFT_1065909 [Amylostereum chailletii]
MAVKRESGFPASSIGRSQGARIQRTPSPSPSLTSTREVLTAHPLLSPMPTPAPAAATNNASPDTLLVPATRYVPYTPRNRTAAATTGTTLQSSLSVSPQQGGDATSKLQLMNLKAYAQSVGLDTTSVGWDMLEKLVGEHDHSPEWAEIWNILTTGQVTLLLPLDQPHGVTINADFVKDHIVLFAGAPGQYTEIVTMSGLRGTLEGQTLTFRSSVKPGSKLYNGLLAPSTRSASLASLAPLPLISSSPLSQAYPTFTLPSHTEALPLPPHVVTKPPLPPRPGQRPSSTSGTPSRLSSSLASLFSKQPVAPTPSPPPPPPPDVEHAVEVPAFTIDRPVIWKDVGRQINKALKAEMKEALTVSGAPSWVVNRVHEFATGMYPFIKSASGAKRPFTGNNPAQPTQTYTIDPPQETVEELSQQFQDFYAELEDEIYAGASPTTSRAPKGSSEGSTDGDHKKEKGKKRLSENSVNDPLEVVERVMCSMFYDRLYLQPQSDDGSHDEALSSRIAALNMLDLGLEHLGVDVGSSGAEIELVLKSCGESKDWVSMLNFADTHDATALHLVSHLLYTQRFRNRRVGGEESYCLVNLMAVADFLENVDLKALGLGESEKEVPSTADLTPIPVTHTALSETPEGVPARLRRGVEQQVDAIAGSANKVILGVVDSSFGVLRSLLPGNVAEGQQAPSSPEEAQSWNVRPSFGLLRRESGFSIASLAASLPGRDRARSISSTAPVEESGQMMVEVASRPGSIRSAYMSDSEGVDESDVEDDGEEEEDEEGGEKHDARSIRSFESMMNAKGRKRDMRSRKSLSDRLASMPGLSRLATSQGGIGMPQPTSGSPPPSRRTSLLLPGVNRFDSPVSSRAASPVSMRVAPPNKRFLECAEDDLRLSEVRELLREYKRVVEAMRAMGGFDE